MYKFNELIKPTLERIENILKFGTYKRTKGSDGSLQDVQIQTMRNIEEAIKMGQFGFNSKAPIGSRLVVTKIANEKIIIANEHIASILDITSGNTVIYNQSGHTIKIEGDNITTTAPNVITNCENFTINSTDTKIIAENGIELESTTLTHNGANVGDTHVHTQNDGNDAGGGVDTTAPSN